MSIHICVYVYDIYIHTFFFRVLYYIYGFFKLKNHSNSPYRQTLSNKPSLPFFSVWETHFLMQWILGSLDPGENTQPLDRHCSEMPGPHKSQQANHGYLQKCLTKEGYSIPSKSSLIHGFNIKNKEISPTCSLLHILHFQIDCRLIAN